MIKNLLNIGFTTKQIENYINTKFNSKYTIEDLCLNEIAQIDNSIKRMLLVQLYEIELRN